MLWALPALNLALLLILYAVVVVVIKLLHVSSFDPVSSKKKTREIPKALFHVCEYLIFVDSWSKLNVCALFSLPQLNRLNASWKFVCLCVYVGHFRELTGVDLINDHFHRQIEITNLFLFPFLSISFINTVHAPPECALFIINYADAISVHVQYFHSNYMNFSLSLSVITQLMLADAHFLTYKLGR